MKKTFFKIICAIVLSISLISCDNDEDSYIPPVNNDLTVSLAAGDSATIVTTINEFRTQTGDPLNTAPGATGGRREVNWDGVPDSLLNANNFPFDFFNATNAGAPNGRKRGLTYFPSNASLRVSNIKFSDIDPSYQFEPFSGSKMFNPNGGNVSDVRFKVPGTNTDAFVKAFGVVFIDVDDANATTVEAFNDNVSLGIAKAQPSNGKFSFVAVKANQQKITRIKITTGNAALASGVKDISNGGNYDLVVMDDFIYSEPVILQ